jgi:hypothetical protein
MGMSAACSSSGGKKEEAGPRVKTGMTKKNSVTPARLGGVTKS